MSTSPKILTPQVVLVLQRGLISADADSLTANDQWLKQAKTLLVGDEFGACTIQYSTI